MSRKKSEQRRGEGEECAQSKRRACGKLFFREMHKTKRTAVGTLQQTLSFRCLKKQFDATFSVSSGWKVLSVGSVRTSIECWQCVVEQRFQQKQKLQPIRQRSTLFHIEVLLCSAFYRVLAKRCFLLLSNWTFYNISFSRNHFVGIFFDQEKREYNVEKNFKDDE